MLMKYIADRLIKCRRRNCKNDWNAIRFFPGHSWFALVADRRSDERAVITLFFERYAPTRAKRCARSLKRDTSFTVAFSVYYILHCVILDEKPIGDSSVAKSTITGPRIATNKSRYCNRCKARLAFSSLRESSSWLPAVIQLLVRKHSQDARRQRAIALKSLAVGFVVRENVFRCLLFSFFLFLPLTSPNVFSIGLYQREKRPMVSQFAASLSRSPRVDHTSFVSHSKAKKGGGGNNRK